jgi:Cu(I)/Ag(I) efflux system membrane fusion protein
LIVLLLVLVLAATSCNKQASSQNAAGTSAATQPAGEAAATATQAKVVYTCPMHPQVQQDKPGKCPLCGMDLVQKT